MTQLPWYHAGLPFECTQCGDCCTGAPGFVWVNDEEIRNLATFLEMPVEEFADRFVRQVGNRRSLVEFPTGDCVFFDTEKRSCQVYEARPRQCKTWPFWHSNLTTPEDWAQVCEVCPGSGQGKTYTLEEIRERLKIVRV